MMAQVTTLIGQGNFKGTGDLQRLSGIPVPAYEFFEGLLFFLKLLYAEVQLVCFAPMAAFPKLEPL